MKCELVQQEIPLYVYGEMPAPAEEIFEEHINVCLLCEQELKKYRAFSDAITNAVEVPPVWLIAECRQSLSHLTRESPKRTHIQTWKLNWDWIFGSSIAFKVPLGAMALLALGFLVARLMPNVVPSLGSSSDGEIIYAGLISSVRSVQPDSSGHVQIDVDETRRRVISGNVQDSNIQQLLLAALRDESNSGVRVDVMNVLKDQAGTANVRKALLEAVAHDPNPGVRLKALEGLKRFEADPETRKTLSRALLADSNPAVRMQVIDLLTSQKDDSLIGMFQSLVQKDDNSYVVQKCQRALQEQNASIGTF